MVTSITTTQSHWRLHIQRLLSVLTILTQSLWATTN